MFDSLAICPQRSFGEALVGLVRRSGQTSLQTLRQVGSAKAFLPCVEGNVPEVVFLNTSGGLTSGDRLDYALDLDNGCVAVATTQTAERCYCCPEGPAVVDVRLRVGAGGRLDWLPQETILYDSADLSRTTTIDLALTSSCLFVETVLLGRAAMGETLQTLSFRDTREIRRNGKPVFFEPLELNTKTLENIAHPALLGDARAFASLILVGSGAEDAAAALRPLLNEPGVESGISGFDGKCILRLLARDGWPLRRQLLRVLPQLLGRPLPRVWQI